MSGNADPPEDTIMVVQGEHIEPAEHYILSSLSVYSKEQNEATAKILISIRNATVIELVILLIVWLFKSIGHPLPPLVVLFATGLYPAILAMWALLHAALEIKHWIHYVDQSFPILGRMFHQGMARCREAWKHIKHQLRAQADNGTLPPVLNPLLNDTSEDTKEINAGSSQSKPAPITKSTGRKRNKGRRK